MSMRPLTLSRVIETAHFAVMNRNITTLGLEKLLTVKKRRAKEILEEMVDLGFLKKEQNIYKPTRNSEHLLRNVRTHNWSGIHEMLMDNKFYSTFINRLKITGPSTSNEILDILTKTGVHYNQTTVSMLCDWGERLGSIQRNIVSGKYYVVLNKKDNILPEFLKCYNSLNEKIGLTLSQRYVEIPKLREMVCQNLNMSRERFDALFKILYQKNIGKIELCGAPFTTHAKKTQKKVKKVIVSDMPDRLTTILSSEKYLNGIIVDRKEYYYVAYHGGELIE